MKTYYQAGRLDIPDVYWKEAPHGWLATSRLSLGHAEFRCFAQPDPTGPELVRGKQYRVVVDPLNFEATELMEGAEPVHLEQPAEVTAFANPHVGAADPRTDARELPLRPTPGPDSWHDPTIIPYPVGFVEWLHELRAEEDPAVSTEIPRDDIMLRKYVHDLCDRGFEDGHGTRWNLEVPIGEPISVETCGFVDEDEIVDLLFDWRDGKRQEVGVFITFEFEAVR